MKAGIRIGSIVVVMLAAACAPTSTPNEPTSSTAATTTAPAPVSSPTTTSTTLPPPQWRTITAKIESPPPPDFDLPGADPSELPHGPAPELLAIVPVSGRYLGIGSAHGGFGVWESTDLEQWEPMYHDPPTRPGEDNAPRWIADIVVDSDRVLVFGAVEDPETRDVAPALRLGLDTGHRWERLADIGDPDDGPADIDDVERFRDGWIAVGVHRHPDRRPYFSPAAWRSNDGVWWEEVPLPAPTGAIDGGPHTVAVSGNTAVATGRMWVELSRKEPPESRPLGDITVAWATSDGATWNATVIGGGGPVKVDTAGRFVIVGGDEAGGHVTRSDNGTTWTTESRPPAFGDDRPALEHVFAWRGRLTVIATVADRSDLQFCFQDPQTCRRRSVQILTEVAPGDWRRLAGPEGGLARIYDVAAVEPALVLLGRPIFDPVSEEAGQTIWIWDDRDSPPAPVFVPPTTTLPPFSVAPVDEPLELAVPYRAAVPLFGCGAEFFRVGGRSWVRVEASFDESIPPEWPVVERTGPHGGVTLYGLVTLVEPDVLEVTTEAGDLVARYEPGEPTYGCF